MGDIVDEILIGVLTYRREQKLRSCLQSILDAELPPSSSMHILVCDNDPESTTAEERTEHYDRLKYGGGSLARGRQFILAEAKRRNVEFLVFVDDDEYVSKTWLVHLVAAARQYQASAVAGPVLPVDVPEALVPLFDRSRKPTGNRLDAAGAGNLLIDMRDLGDIEFDQEWPYLGGEDTDFTMRLSYHGNLIWCDEAEVFEPVADNRQSAAYLIRRFLNNGKYLRLAERRNDIQPTGARIARAWLGALLISPTTFFLLKHPKAFRYCLDNGIRQVGYATEDLKLRRIRLRSPIGELFN